MSIKVVIAGTAWAVNVCGDCGDIVISFDVLTRGRGGGVGQSRQLNVGWQACAAAESRRAATRMAQVVRCCKYWAATAENCGQGSWSMRWPRSVLKSG